MASVKPIRLHYNTVYLVEEGDESVLVDTGPDYRGAWAHVLAEAGGTPPLVVATHGHHDHAGLGRDWQEAGSVVALGEADRYYATQPAAHHDAELAMLDRLVEESGAPPDAVAEARLGVVRRRQHLSAASDAYPPAGSHPRWPTGLRYRHFEPGRLLAGDTPLPAGLEALACPGHTPGNLVLVQRSEGWLFSGDQLLPDITPTPGLQLDAAGTARFRSLPAFLASLARLAVLRPVRCFPGHGQPFDSVAAAIASNIGSIEQRTERVFEALRTDGPATTFALAERLYPRALRRRYWQIVPTVIGHLDLLEERGQVSPREGRWEVS